MATSFNTQNIPFLPSDSTWEAWNGNMLHYFSQETLPYVVEESWREFAHAMVGLATFDAYGIPAPENYDQWQDWVSSMITAVNGPNQ
jgi:hypothetical protein